MVLGGNWLPEALWIGEVVGVALFRGAISASCYFDGANDKSGREIAWLRSKAGKTPEIAGTKAGIDVDATPDFGWTAAILLLLDAPENLLHVRLADTNREFDHH